MVVFYNLNDMKYPNINYASGGHIDGKRKKTFNKYSGFSF